MGQLTRRNVGGWLVELEQRIGSIRTCPPAAIVARLGLLEQHVGQLHRALRNRQKE